MFEQLSSVVSAVTGQIAQEQKLPEAKIGEIAGISSQSIMESLKGLGGGADSLGSLTELFQGKDNALSGQLISNLSSALVGQAGLAEGVAGGFASSLIPKVFSLLGQNKDGGFSPAALLGALGGETGGPAGLLGSIAGGLFGKK